MTHFLCRFPYLFIIYTGHDYQHCCYASRIVNEVTKKKMKRVFFVVSHCTIVLSMDIKFGQSFWFN